MNKITLDDKPEIFVGLIARSLDQIDEALQEEKTESAHFMIVNLRQSVGKLFERLGGVEKVRSHIDKE